MLARSDNLMATNPPYIKYLIYQLVAVKEIMEDCGVLSHKMNLNISKIIKELEEIED